MKKVLLATTALAMSAGVAAADVAVSGAAEIGVKGADPGNLEFHHDIAVTFKMSGTTDGGLEFGGKIGLEEAEGGVATDKEDDYTVFLSGNFGKITMGDTDGALDWAMTEVAFGGSLADDHTTHAGYNGNSGLDGKLDGQIARYEYSFGDFAFAVSAELDDAGAKDTIWGIGGKYSGDLGGVKLGVGLGYQSGTYSFKLGSGGSAALVTAAALPFPSSDLVMMGTADLWGLSVSAGFAGGFKAVVNYSKLDGSFTSASGTTTALSAPATPVAVVLPGVGTATATIPAGAASAYSISFAGAPVAVEWDHVGVGVQYKTGALGVEANYGKYDATIGGVAADADGWGLAAQYDLGGGAQVQFGYGNGTGFFATSDSSTYSLGIAMSF